MLTEIEKAYIAGIIDADGCISMDKSLDNRNKVKYYNYVPRIHVSMTAKCVVDWIGEKVCGTTRKYIYVGKSKNQSHKPVYTWRISCKKAIELCRQLEPYLILKKPRAHVLIEFEKTIKPNNIPGRKTRFIPLKEEERFEKEKLWNELKLLNRKGI